MSLQSPPIQHLVCRICSQSQRAPINALQCFVNSADGDQAANSIDIVAVYSFIGTSGSKEAAKALAGGIGVTGASLRLSWTSLIQRVAGAGLGAAPNMCCTICLFTF
jgi:hypothetical protein